MIELIVALSYFVVNNFVCLLCMSYVNDLDVHTQLFSGLFTAAIFIVTLVLTFPLGYNVFNKMMLLLL